MKTIEYEQHRRESRFFTWGDGMKRILKRKDVWVNVVRLVLIIKEANTSIIQDLRKLIERRGYLVP